LSKLKPVFRNGGQVTAGNSSQTSDAAAFVLVVSERVVKELNLQPIARMITTASVGVDPNYHGHWPCSRYSKSIETSRLNVE
jgi:acetyl-CoA acyltransferase